MIEIMLLSSGEGVIISGPTIVENNNAVSLKLYSTVPIPDDCYLSAALPKNNTYRYIKNGCVEIPYYMLSPGVIKMAVVSNSTNKIWRCEKIEIIELKNGGFLLLSCDRGLASQIAELKIAMDKLSQIVEKHDELVTGFDKRLDEIMGNYDLL